MIRIMTPGGDTHSGQTARQVIEDMHERAIFLADQSTDEYLIGLRDRGKEFYGVSLGLEGDTLDERCESMLASILKHGLAVTIPEEEDAT
ncbi:MAG: hypothetical protein F4Y47_07570 [Acidobacteriia bacterium]|nr:hypothetical protein [Terriglobia bacterium]MYG01949.1 hypothetical protein [Terriglobia bacterium]MYK11115.1 hypothetical protein [Terriglobia bacterium]